MEQNRRMKRGRVAAAAQLDKSYRRLAPIANYTFPHPALFPNQGALESQRLLWDIATQQSWTWARAVDWNAAFKFSSWPLILLFQSVRHQFPDDLILYRGTSSGISIASFDQTPEPYQNEDQNTKRKNGRIRWNLHFQLLELFSPPRWMQRHQQQPSL